jgi:hypothetical protein
MKDKGEPGKENDMIAITIKDGDALLFTSNWDATKMQTVERVINGGNLSANSSANVGNTTTPITYTNGAIERAITEETTGQKFELKAFPNPTQNQFKVHVESSNRNDKIMLRVYDAYGRTVRLIRDAMAGQTITLGNEYRPGIYYIEMIQGKNRQQVKLLKVVY